jgi:hypothetical protein
MNLRTLFLAAPLAVVLACGGSTSNGTGSAALDAAVPSYASLSLDQTAADTAAPTALLVAPNAALVAEPGSAQVQGFGGCHPHLFMREREVVERVNRHIYKVLKNIEKLIARTPLTETDSSKTWTKVEGGAEISFTIKLVSPNVYSWTFAAGPAGTTNVVMTGVIDRNGATGKHQGKGSMAIDFAVLNAAFPNERVAQGTLEVQFDVSATARKITVVAEGIAWEMDPRHFDSSVVPAALSAPRSGAYVFFREPGKGGSLKIQDQMVFACGMDRMIENATLVPADARMVSRWYKAADGTVHGRSDGSIKGGNLVAPVNQIVGVTCHNASAEQHMPTEGYWLMKAEDAAGATLVGFSAGSMMDTAATPCDPIFGAVPTLVDSANDFTGWPTSYSDNTPFPFPGM